MEVRITYNDDCGSCVLYNDVVRITQYNDEIVLYFAPYSNYKKAHEYSHCILRQNKIKHLKVLFD